MPHTDRGPGDRLRTRQVQLWPSRGLCHRGRHIGHQILDSPEARRRGAGAGVRESIPWERGWTQAAMQGRGLGAGEECARHREQLRQRPGGWQGCGHSGGRRSVLSVSQLPLPVTLCHQPAGTLHSTAEIQRGHSTHTCRLSAKCSFPVSRHIRASPGSASRSNLTW